MTVEDEVQEVIMGPPSKNSLPDTERKSIGKPSNPPKGRKLLDAPKTISATTLLVKVAIMDYGTTVGPQSIFPAELRLVLDEA